MTEETRQAQLSALIAEQEHDSQYGDRVWSTRFVDLDLSRLSPLSRRSPMRSATKKVRPRRRHGTLEAYAIRGCRCGDCCTAADKPKQGRYTTRHCLACGARFVGTHARAYCSTRCQGSA